MPAPWGSKHLIQRLTEALVWCSGSGDFQPKGKARKGWMKICQPVLEQVGVVVPMTRCSNHGFVNCVRCRHGSYSNG